MELSIEKSPFASTNHYAGVYTDDQNRDYGFTVVESVNVDLALCGIEEIVWVDGAPIDQFEVEAQIEAEFKLSCDD